MPIILLWVLKGKLNNTVDNLIRKPAESLLVPCLLKDIISS